MRQKIRILFVTLIFIFGLILFSYPLVNEYKNNGEVKKTKEKFEKTIEELNEITEEESPLDSLYNDIKLYNENIYINRQSDLKDPWSYEQSSFKLSEYGIEEDIIGYITIPNMKIELPIYLGANTHNMAKGAVHMSETSLPLGGENTNCVIAAHRGYKGIPMFCDIEILEIGDEVIIKNLWETLKYRVTEIKIIVPSQVSEVLIQPGKDMVTLLTCHPYTKNYQRYIVYCERETEENSKKPIEIESSEEKDEITKEEKDSKKISESEYRILIDRYLPLIGLIIMGIILIVVIFTGKKKK